jgi:phytoene synthase
MLLSQMPNISETKNFATAADRTTCRAMIKNGSKSFFTASLILPAAVREDAYALYAFCRLSDDMVDVDGGTEAAIAKLRARLDLVYMGQPIDNPVDRVFADVVMRYVIPRKLPDALIEGLDWDVRGVTCETLSDVYAYAARVAGSVGAMMAVLMGVRSPQLLARACDLGIAMQLTNIARDVGEDARQGRLYLPRAWLREAGLDPEAWLQTPAYSAALASVIARLLDHADQLYRRADAGIAGLPAACRPGIFAARYIYDAIGTKVAQRRFDSVTARARVSLFAKLGYLGQALILSIVARATMKNLAALPEAAYLVEAVTSACAPTDQPRPGIFDRMADRVVWVAHLFAELEARERASASQV